MLVQELDLDLDAFEGPFDLLLTLVLKDELPAGDVDVAAIVVEFCERLAEREVSARSWDDAAGAGPEGTVLGTGPESTVPEAASADGGAGLRPAGAVGGQGRAELDLEACGEFLVLVAGLLELKVRALFGGEGEDGLELDPDEAAEELAERLAEYRRIREAAAWLAERLGEERFFRVGPSPFAPAPERQLAPQDPAVLGDALRALAAEPPDVSLAHMALRFPPVSVFLERFRAVLRRRRRFDFDAEVARLSRVEQAVAFLALLELRKSGEVRLEQAAPFAPIRVGRAGGAVEEVSGWSARSA